LAAADWLDSEFMKRIKWQEAEAILGFRVDRRKVYDFDDSPEMREILHGGPVYHTGWWTETCSGCTESYMGHYTLGSAERGVGCSECGYTGKRRQCWSVPVEAKSNSNGQTGR
jgi:hypothetical protein